MTLSKILKKFNDQLKEYPMEENISDLQNISEYADDFKTGKLSEKHENEIRGLMWKSMTKLDSFKQNYFKNYRDI